MIIKPYFNDWFHHIAWIMTYDREHRGYSRFQQAQTVIRSFVTRWAKYKGKDRSVFFDWSRFTAKEAVKQYAPQFVDGKWLDDAAKRHQEWDINLSQMACGRVCGQSVDGDCPYPFELDEGYWIREHRLPLYSSYARRAFTPKFAETEDVMDAKFMHSQYKGIQEYTINDYITGWIVHRQYGNP